MAIYLEGREHPFLLHPIEAQKIAAALMSGELQTLTLASIQPYLIF